VVLRLQVLVSVLLLVQELLLLLLTSTSFGNKREKKKRRESKEVMEEGFCKQQQRCPRPWFYHYHHLYIDLPDYVVVQAVLDLLSAI
jgi:hypothetical protein